VLSIAPTMELLFGPDGRPIGQHAARYEPDAFLTEYRRNFDNLSLKFICGVKRGWGTSKPFLWCFGSRSEGGATMFVIGFDGPRLNHAKACRDRSFKGETMSDEWFYADGETPVGPLSFDALVKHLRTTSTPDDVKVWRVGFQDWQLAKEVTQIRDQVFRPPPISNEKRPPPIANDKTVPLAPLVEPQSRVLAKIDSPQTNKQQWALVAATFLMVLVTGSFISARVYNFSSDGVAELIGQYVGSTVILSLLAWRFWGKSIYRTGWVVLILSLLNVAVINQKKFSESVTTNEAIAALKSVDGPNQIDKALKQNPSNAMLQLFSVGSKLAEESSQLVQKLSDGIEPPSLANDIDYATATRAALEAYRRDLKVAENNANGAMSRYLLILKDERDKCEKRALALQMDPSIVSSFLNGVDKRHARNSDFASRMFSARAELYRALESTVAIAIDQFGNYKTNADGQLIFANLRAADSYNSAVTALAAKVKTVGDLEKEGAQLQQWQKEQWQRLVSGDLPP
jgi:GYF domain 2